MLMWTRFPHHKQKESVFFWTPEFIKYVHMYVYILRGCDVTLSKSDYFAVKYIENLIALPTTFYIQSKFMICGDLYQQFVNVNVKAVHDVFF